MSYRVYRYEILSNDEPYFVMADDFECGGEGLKFWRDGTMVAWFQVWSHWRREDCDEVQRNRKRLA